MLVATCGVDVEPWKRHRRVVATIREAMEDVDRHQADNMPLQMAAYNAPSDIPGLDNIVHIDLDSSTAWVEPNVTMEMLVEATLVYGLIPAVVPTTRLLTVANAFAATTTGSSSFKYGTFDCTVLSLECILSDGQYVMATTNDCLTSDLLFGSAGAMHSLALTTLLEIALVPASEYVEITYWPFSSVSGALCKTHSAEQDSSVDFIETIVMETVSSIVAVGRFTLEAETLSTPHSLGEIDFVQHVRSIWQEIRCAGEQRIDVVHIMKYLFRYDDRYSITGMQSEPLGRSNRLQPTLQAQALNLQDIGLPFQAAKEQIRSFNESQSIWPIWIIPVISPQALGRRSFGVGPKYEHSFWNLKFYASSANWNGAMERHLRDLHGFRYLHSRAPSSDVAAWIFHDDRWYSRLQSRWRAERFYDVGTRLRTSRPLTCA
jgi:delta24-sterol reductase